MVAQDTGSTPMFVITADCTCDLRHRDRMEAHILLCLRDCPSLKAKGRGAGSSWQLVLSLLVPHSEKGKEMDGTALVLCVFSSHGEPSKQGYDISFVMANRQEMQAGSSQLCWPQDLLGDLPV